MTPLGSYANKFIAEKGNIKPTEKEMNEVFSKCVLPLRKEKYEEVKRIIIEKQNKEYK